MTALYAMLAAELELEQLAGSRVRFGPVTVRPARRRRLERVELLLAFAADELDSARRLAQRRSDRVGVPPRGG